MTADQVAVLVCPHCRTSLAADDGTIACARCRRRWPVHDGIPTFVDASALGGTEAFMHLIYDWLAPLHDPLVDVLLPVLQGSSVAATRNGYLRRLELGALPQETSGRPARILEVGIGGGGNLPYLDRHLPAGLPVELWGVDLSTGMLSQCRRRLARETRPVRLVHADAHALPFPDAFFDRVFHVGGIATYRDTARALLEMARVARPGTPIVVVDEQLDARGSLSLFRRLAFSAITFYDSAPHAPRECLPPTACDVLEEQVSAFYYCLRFRTDPAA